MAGNKNWADNWAEIIIAPIYKKGDKQNPINYRPISLVNTGLKLYTMLMTNRLNAWCDKNDKVSQFQAAYRKGMGCEDHIFVLNSILQNNLRNRKGKVYALFVDLRAAFDRIQHDKLWFKLKRAGLSDKMLKVIKDIYSKAKAKIRTSDGESNFFPFKKAVLQDPVTAYLGIPYASPPINAYRFMPPVAPLPWRETRPAMTPPPACPQRFPDISNRTRALETMTERRYLFLSKLIPHLANQSEDCLYLNFYVPTSPPGEPGSKL
ncbi:Neuroligin-2 [Folsomia candida]|uniref:Neuroligin-2 n=1 Tax=Folsomia candida TaxID=158441 RepID=A0A226DG14_FOLCA|nr:Neuroligin-2 [Folsomia candida]